MKPCVWMLPETRLTYHGGEFFNTIRSMAASPVSRPKEVVLRELSVRAEKAERLESGVRRLRQITHLVREIVQGNHRKAVEMPSPNTHLARPPGDETPLTTITG